MMFLGKTYGTLHSIITAVAAARVIWCAIEIVNIVFTTISNLNVFEGETAPFTNVETGHPDDPSICH